MSELPKIVKSQLATPVTAEHPNADLLTAFLENGLPSREREQVINHLAVCSDCRDVVALAMPDAAEKEPVMQKVATPVPRRFPMWRWVTVAAIAVVAGGVAWRVKLEKGSSLQQASAPPASTVDQYARADQVAPAAEPPAKQPAEKLASAERKQEATSTLASGGPGYSESTRALRDKDQRARTNEVAQGREYRAAPAAAPASPARADLGALVQNKPAPTPAQPEAENSAASADEKLSSKKDTYTSSTAPTQTVAVQSAPAEERQAADARLHAKVATPTGTVEETTGASGQVLARREGEGKMLGGALGKAAAETEAGPNFAMKSAALARLPQWQLDSANNNLQRSFDAGRNWSNVDVGGPVNAYVVVGTHIWAGGNRGALYHSDNLGGNWTRVPISELSDDIREVKFKDPEHGQLKTSRREVWTTTDGGQTWKKK